jgi:hypothetical protein
MLTMMLMLMLQTIPAAPSLAPAPSSAAPPPAVYTTPTQNAKPCRVDYKLGANVFAGDGSVSSYSWHIRIPEVLTTKAQIESTILVCAVVPVKVK